MVFLVDFSPPRIDFPAPRLTSVLMLCFRTLDVSFLSPPTPHTAPPLLSRRVGCVRDPPAALPGSRSRLASSCSQQSLAMVHVRVGPFQGNLCTALLLLGRPIGCLSVTTLRNVAYPLPGLAAHAGWRLWRSRSLHMSTLPRPAPRPGRESAACGVFMMAWSVAPRNVDTPVPTPSFAIRNISRLACVWTFRTFPPLTGG